MRWYHVSEMRKVVRFILIVLVSAVAITIAGRLVGTFDIVAEDDPYDRWRGMGVCVAAILVAALDALLYRRRRTTRPN